MTIHKALLGAMRDIAKTGIAKLGRADTGGAKYNFRGIDQAMNEMSPILINNGIAVTPRYSDLTIQERAKADGKFMRFVTVKGAFTFSADDGSSVVAEAYGEAMDSGDKATIKAQSVAFRTVLFQQFIVPLMSMDTELDGEEDDGNVEDSWEAKANKAATLDDLDALRKPAVAALNKARDTKGYALFVEALKRRGAELRAGQVDPEFLAQMDAAGATNA